MLNNSRSSANLKTGLRPIVPLTIVLYTITAVFLIYALVDNSALSLSTFGLLATLSSLLTVIGASRVPQSSFGVAIVAILALVYAGGWILERIFHDQHYSRRLVFTDHTLALSVAIAGIGLLVFSLAYAESYARKQKKEDSVISAPHNPAIDKIPWGILILWGVGVFVFETLGGYSVLQQNAGIYIFQALFSFLAKPLITVISIKIIASSKKKGQGLIISIIIWVIYTLLTGQRQYIVAIGLCTIILINKWRVLLTSYRTLLTIAVIFILGAVGMIYLRSTFGREVFTDLPVSEQMNVLLNDHTQTLNNYISFTEALEYDLGYRLNATNVLLGLLAEQPTKDILWIEPLTYSLAKMVPGFIWTTKSTDAVGELPALIAQHYNLPASDYVSLFITSFYAMGGIHTVIIFCLLSGYLISYLDRKFEHSTSVFGLMFAVGIGHGVLSIDHSINILMLSLRDSIILFIVIRFSIALKETLGRKLIS